MKIWFQCAKLPQDIKIMYQNYKITPFIDRPWQCYKCQKFGHSAKFCRGKEVCLILCTGEHNHKGCASKGDDEKKKSANFGGKHTSNSKDCPNIKQEKEVQLIRVNQNLSYRDAVKTMKESTKNRNQQNVQQITSTITTPAGKTLPNANTKKNTINATTANQQANPTNISMEKLALCILDIFSTFQRSDNLSKKCSLLANAFSLHLGIEMDRTILLNQVKVHTNKLTQWPSQSPIINTKSVHHAKNVRKS